MRPKTKKSNRKNLTWAAILAAVPLAALLWTVLTYVIDRSPAVLPQTRIIMLLDDELVDFVNPAKQKGFLTDSPFHSAIILTNACYQELLSRFTPTALHNDGRTVKSAVFLAVTNAGHQSASVVRFQASPDLSDFHNLAPAETLLMCMRVDRVDGSELSVDVRSVELVPRRGLGQSARIPSIPAPSDMAVWPGKPGFLLGFPTANSEP